MNLYIVSVAVVTPIIGLFLVLRYRWFIRRLREPDTSSQPQNRKNLLNKKASYSKYKSVATKASVPNRPARSSGDFLDFFLSYTSNTAKNEIEGMLFSVDCGEVYE